MANTKQVEQVKDGRLLKILTEIQNELNVPKSRVNKFGGFNYRSAEDIEQKLKPILLEKNVSLFSDTSVKIVGERVYLVVTVTLTDGVNQITSDGWAREAENKKGMDDAQISGAANSYAKKYALGNMFLIDDSADDPDSQQLETVKKTIKKKTVNSSENMVNELEKETALDDLREAMKSIKTVDDVESVVKQIHNAFDLDYISEEQFKKGLQKMKDIKGELTS